MKENKRAFKDALKILKRERREGVRQFKAERLLTMLRQKARFSGGDLFYGRQNLRLLNFAYVNPAATLRCAVVLKDSVDFQRLENALYDAAASLPSLRLSVRRGFFSPYLQPVPRVPSLSPPTETARAFSADRTAHEFRAGFYKNRIVLELSGYLADFYALNAFLSSLTLAYLGDCGNEGLISSRHPLDRPAAAELDEPFRLVDRLSKEEFKELKRTEKQAGARCLKLKGDEEIGITNLTCFEVDGAALSRVSGGDVNAYLVKLWGQAVKRAKGQNARVGVYVNGRAFYESESMRCFSVLVPADENFSYDGGKTGFDRAASFNLEGGKKRVRYLPMPFKTLKYRCKRRFTAVYADAGRFGLQPHAAALRFEGGYMGCEPLSLTKAEYADKTTLTVLSKFSDTDVEYEFFKSLPSQLNAVVGTNRRNNII